MFRRQIKKTKCAGDTQASAVSYTATISLIHQQQVGVKELCQSDGGGLSFIKTRHQGQPGRFMDF